MTEMKGPAGAPNPVAALITQPIASKVHADLLMEGVARVPDVIADHDLNGRVGQMVKQLRMQVQKLEAERKAIVGPINEGVKRINARFAIPKDLLNGAIQTLQRRSTAFLLEQERLAREKEAEMRALQEEAALEQAEALQETGQHEEATEAIEEAVEIQPIVVAETQSKSELGVTTSLRDNWTWDVMDSNLIPREYLTIDTVKVNKAVRGDKVREIPGLNIWNDRQSRSV